MPDDECANWPQPSPAQWALLALPLLALHAAIGGMLLASWILRELASLFTGKDEHAC
ncbi:hypothetical protein [Novosphingobium sp.]|uniref:hypothetical protein n=1 Tax=Novosphingobium sp. TaxID=1874826 RepID=UPI00286D86C9|nr:hypothetical protein [Novosphingobium sp.]